MFKSVLSKYLRASLELQGVQDDVRGLVSLHALAGVVEELVQRGALALLQRVAVQDPVRGAAGVPGLDARLHQQVLRRRGD